MDEVVEYRAAHRTVRSPGRASSRVWLQDVPGMDGHSTSVGFGSLAPRVFQFAQGGIAAPFADRISNASEETFAMALLLRLFCDASGFREQRQDVFDPKSHKLDL